MKNLILIALTTLLFACSSNGKNEETQLTAAQKASGYECKNIKVTGTRINKKVCDTAAERQYKKEHAEEFSRKMRDERNSASNQNWEG